MVASMLEDDRSYYQHRAKVEVEPAQAATLPSVVQTQYQLAKAYLGKLATDEPARADAS